MTELPVLLEFAQSQNAMHRSLISGLTVAHSSDSCQWVGSMALEHQPNQCDELEISALLAQYGTLWTMSGAFDDAAQVPFTM